VYVPHVVDVGLSVCFSGSASLPLDFYVDVLWCLVEEGKQRRAQPELEPFTLLPLVKLDHLVEVSVHPVWFVQPDVDVVLGHRGGGEHDRALVLRLVEGSVWLDAAAGIVEHEVSTEHEWFFFDVAAFVVEHPHVVLAVGVDGEERVRHRCCGF